MCRTDRASVAPVPYSYGVGLGALFVSCSYNMAALPNVCRLGYAVVSGPRETRQSASVCLLTSSVKPIAPSSFNASVE